MSAIQGGKAALLIGLPESGYLPRQSMVPTHGGPPSVDLSGLLHALSALPVGEWIVAMACAMIAAIAYEAAVKVLKETRQVTLMLPALLLRLTRLTTSRAKYRLLYERQWYPDLYDLLTDTHHAAFARYVKGLRFSLALVLGGAIRAARQTQTPVRRTHRRSDRPVRMLVSGTVAGYTGAKLAGDSSSYILKALAAMASLGAIGITVAIWRFHRRRPQRRKQRP